MRWGGFNLSGYWQQTCRVGCRGGGGALLDWRGTCGEGKGDVGGSGQGGFVECESGEVVEEGWEAVDGEAYGSSARVGLFRGGVGDAGGLDGRGACGAGCGAVVLEEERREPLSQVPPEVVGEHAEEGVGADARCGLDEERAHLRRLLME